MSKRCLTCHWRQERIEELEAALARADGMLIQREQAYTQKAEWYEQALQEQQAKVERLEALLYRWLEDMNTTGPGDYSLADDTEKALGGKQDG